MLVFHRYKVQLSFRYQNFNISINIPTTHLPTIQLNVILPPTSVLQNIFHENSICIVFPHSSYISPGPSQPHTFLYPNIINQIRCYRNVSKMSCLSQYVSLKFIFNNNNDLIFLNDQ